MFRHGNGFQQLAEFFGTERIAWRYDPILRKALCPDLQPTAPEALLQIVQHLSISRKDRRPVFRSWSEGFSCMNPYLRRYKTMRNMIAYCGLDCEKCDAYLATIKDDQTLREKTAKLWAELNNAPILPEHINCQGCRVDGIKTVFCDSLCEIRQCALKKGVTTCGDCPDMETCQTVGMIISNNPETLKNLRG